VQRVGVAGVAGVMASWASRASRASWEVPHGRYGQRRQFCCVDIVSSPEALESQQQ
jgi:hypothetical protein